MRNRCRRQDRDHYKDAAKAERWAMRLYADADAHWTRADTVVFHTVLAVTASYSKVWEWVTLPLMSRLTGFNRRTLQRSLHKLDAHAVIYWEPGEGRDWSRVSLPTVGGRLAWTEESESERRSHTTASRTAQDTQSLAAGDAGRETAHGRPPLDALEAVTSDRLRGGDDSAAPKEREGFSRSKRTNEKEEQVSGLAPRSEEGEGTEQSSIPYSPVVTDADTGEEIDPGLAASLWP